MNDNIVQIYNYLSHSNSLHMGESGGEASLFLFHYKIAYVLILIRKDI